MRLHRSVIPSRLPDYSRKALGSDGLGWRGERPSLRSEDSERKNNPLSDTATNPLAWQRDNTVVDEELNLTKHGSASQ